MMTNRFPLFDRLAAPCRPTVCALLIAAMFAVSACSTNPATGEQSFTGFMSKEEEQKVGAEEHPKVTAQFGGVYDDDDIGAYVAELGARLVRVTETPDAKFTFTVLDSDVINAFALPGGYVYISRGLIALAENEAELVSVIGHEIGHVTARHTAQRYSQAVATNIGLSIIGVIGAIAGVPGEANQLLSVGATAVLQGYSRDQELQADELGVRYMSRLNYDPEASRTFFEKMAGNDQLRSKMTGRPTGEESYNFASSHPRTSDRIQQAINLAAETQVAEPLLNRDRFLSEIDGMIFGDSPEQGIRRGRTFSHAGLSISFTVPPGYNLQNSPEAVVAESPDGGRVIFDMASSTAARSTTSLRSYLINEWGKNLGLVGVEEITVNGMEAMTGRTRGRTSAGEREIRLVAIRGATDQIFRLAFITPPERLDTVQEELQRTTYSFRRLSAAEIAELRPLRIRTRTVRSSDTVNSLESDMAVEQYKADWFTLLNQTALNDALQTGERVKLVGE